MSSDDLDQVPSDDGQADAAASETGSSEITTLDPPTTVVGVLKQLGPGLIIAGSIVGSGELIATTKTGADAGMSLLWLILLGCVIKVFVQVELGRYSIINGKTTFAGLAALPGPRIGRGHLIIWYWLVMFVAIMCALGGIVGGVGQALSISIPITDRGRSYNDYREAETQLTVLRGTWQHMAGDEEQKSELVAQISPLHTQSIDSYLELEAGNVAGQKKQQLLKLKADLQQVAEASRDTPSHQIYHKLLPRGDLAEWVALEVQLAGMPAEELATEGNKALVVKRDEARAPVMAAADLLGPEAADFISSYVAALTFQPATNRLDPNIWTALLTVITILLLVIGRYSFIQTFTTTLVGLFTLVTIVNVLGLQTLSSADTWRITSSEFLSGLTFSLPKGEWWKALATALATFGIIGVGAAELIAYPYWCMEHGYARFTGPRDDTDAWGARARGWMRVLRWDAWCSMVIYTFATIAFYMLGTAILHRIQLSPAGDEMIRSLGVMYRPVFGQVAESLFLFGAFAVLYSTFFVASAGNARVLSDVLRTLGFIEDSEKSYRKNVKRMCVILPAICGITSIVGFKPVVAVLLSGTMQGIMLPMVAAAAIYFRYYKGDKRVTPGKSWDMLLWASAVGMLITGCWTAGDKIVAQLSNLFS